MHTDTDPYQGLVLLEKLDARLSSRILRQPSKLEPVPEKSDNIRSENPQPMDSHRQANKQHTDIYHTQTITKQIAITKQVGTSKQCQANAYDECLNPTGYGELTRLVIIANPTDPELALDNRDVWRNSKTCKWMERGRQELRVAANRASIGAPDQKLSRPKVDVNSERIDSEQLSNQFLLSSLSHSSRQGKGKNG
ncbi:hypothetical protein PIB30_037562 [Stylosanthes scabra]|uniref:Uncharacterized protein n=1 Tax=Stylosanthes scabra TaxID=79078 RepID=A0ABU6TDG5_9FABA|nr:hypothetical protein [Stylosanthes scabra]